LATAYTGLAAFGNWDEAGSSMADADVETFKQSAVDNLTNMLFGEGELDSDLMTKLGITGNKTEGYTRTWEDESGTHSIKITPESDIKGMFTDREWQEAWAAGRGAAAAYY
jgi:hypothetical protein